MAVLAEPAASHRARQPHVVAIYRYRCCDLSVPLLRIIGTVVANYRYRYCELSVPLLRFIGTVVAIYRYRCCELSVPAVAGCTRAEDGCSEPPTYLKRVDRCATTNRSNGTDIRSNGTDNPVLIDTRASAPRGDGPAVARFVVAALGTCAP